MRSPRPIRPRRPLRAAGGALAAVGALGAAAALAPSAQAQAPTSAPTSAPSSGQSTHQVYWATANHQLTIVGHGYGHGHGMSQYGAQGAAIRGLTAAQILAFYYPGTATSSYSGNVRVLLTALSGTGTLTVAASSGLTLHDLGSGRTTTLPRPAGVTAWRLRVDGGKLVVGYDTGSWHRWTGTQPTGDAAFTAPGGVTAGGRTYGGSVELVRSTRDVVDTVSMDDYVRGVVPSEMPTSWKPAAVQAQAIAARTYAANAIGSAGGRDWQICDTTACQVYGGLSAETAGGNAAVTATAGRILTSGGRPAFTQFSSSDGGWTSAGGYPYLIARADPYDGVGSNPVHTWTTTVDTRTIEHAYPQLGTLRRIVVTRRDGHGAWAGRVQTALLDGTRHDVTVSGDALRSLLGLRSTWFAVADTPIAARWHALGGRSSSLGATLGPEYVAGKGVGQRFARGRIFYSKATGVHVLTGAVLKAYLARGGSHSALGLPTSDVLHETGGTWARFQHGALHVHVGSARARLVLG